MIRWAVFVSGLGSNLAALLEIRDKYPMALVVSSKESAYAVTRAREAQVPVQILPTPIDWAQVLKHLEEAQITHIFLAGFMKVLPQNFLQNWDKPILNLHPSLLPDYPGLKSIERAYNDRADIGVTIHHVTEAVDDGEILLQEKVFDGEQAQSLSLEEVTKSVHQVEHRLVCQAVEKICGGHHG